MKKSIVSMLVCVVIVCGSAMAGGENDNGDRNTRPGYSAACARQYGPHNAGMMDPNGIHRDYEVKEVVDCSEKDAKIGEQAALEVLTAVIKQAKRQGPYALEKVKKAIASVDWKKLLANLEKVIWNEDAGKHNMIRAMK